MNRVELGTLQVSGNPMENTRNWELIRSILQTAAYADIFDYPLKPEEIYRYLHGADADLDEIQGVLDSGQISSNSLAENEGYYFLPGRHDIIRTRVRRASLAEGLWSRAIKYGGIISRLPFVRMVAITGALAMDNEGRKDIDYLIVTEPGRLWVCRGLVILVVRLAGLRGDLVCPNYFISENALLFDRRDLYTAHEITQMVPLHGLPIYWKMRKINQWTEEFLPNAVGLPRAGIPVSSRKLPGFFTSIAEFILRSRPGSWLEKWEMRRKILKFSRQMPASSEADFSPDWCKGHFGEYGLKTMRIYNERSKVMNESFSLGV